MRQILEKSREFGIELRCLFIDFKTAYDSVDRDFLLVALAELGIPDKLLRLVGATLTHTLSCVKLSGCLTEYFEIKNGVRQGDALACLLFNLALEWAVRNSGINTRGTIFTKIVQLLAYADDIVIIARTKKALLEAFTALKNSTEMVHLIINEEKTKYLPVTKTPVCYKYLETENFKFEVVDNFTYLGSNINTLNDMGTELKRRILAANRCLHGLRKFLKSNLIKSHTKIMLYKTIIRPVLIYGSETWTLTKTQAEKLAIFERKVLRKIFGAVNEKGVWRQRYNFELYKLFKDSDIIKFIKIGRLRYAGHICRMDPSSLTYRIFNHKPIGTRKRGRPKLRWTDCVEEDLKILGVKNWKTTAMRRSEWGKVLRKALAHKGLSSQ